jgi:anti-sigma factor RsiW
MPMRQRTNIVHQATARALETWAAQKRLLFTGSEGYAPRSVIERMRREREGAGEGRKLEQRWLEVYRGDGLMVQLVVVELAEIPRMALSAYYMLRGAYHVSVAHQAASIGITTTEYWGWLRAGEIAVETGLKLWRKWETRSERAGNG